MWPGAATGFFCSKITDHSWNWATWRHSPVTPGVSGRLSTSRVILKSIMLNYLVPPKLRAPMRGILFSALAKGNRVTILERGGPGHDGCSLGNAGMVVASHVIPLAAPGMVALGWRMMWNPESPFYIQPRLDADLLSWAWKFYRACSHEHV